MAKKKKVKPKAPGIEQMLLNPDLVGPGMSDLRKVENLQHWEDQVVEWLFVRHRIRGNVRQALRARHLEMTGEEQMTLEAWNDGFPTYPVFFVGAMIRGINQIPWGHVFCKFRQTQMLRKYNEAENEYGDQFDKPLAMVIRWPHLVRSGEPSGGMVLTDKHPDLRIDGFRGVWSYSDPEPAHLTMLPLSLLIKEIDAAEGGAWRP